MNLNLTLIGQFVFMGVFWLIIAMGLSYWLACRYRYDRLPMVVAGFLTGMFPPLFAIFFACVVISGRRPAVAR